MGQVGRSGRAGVLTNNLLTTATTLNLTTLVSLLNTSGLTAPFVAPGTLTLFGPTNAAFAAIPAPLVGWLTHPRAANLAGLQSVLTYHALPAKVFSPAISTAGTPLASLCTTCTPVLSALRNASTGAVTINTVPVTSVTSANNPANNGVLHQISAVLVPSGVLPTNDIVAAAKATPSLSALYGLLNSTGLLPALTLGTNSFTVFAPSNTAFDLVPSYIKSNVTLLTKVLLYHVINGRTYASDLPNNTAVRAWLAARGAGAERVLERRSGLALTHSLPPPPSSFLPFCFSLPRSSCRRSTPPRLSPSCAGAPASW